MMIFWFGPLYAWEYRALILRWSEIALVNSDYNKLLRFSDLVLTEDSGALFLRDTKKTKLFGIQ